MTKYQLEEKATHKRSKAVTRACFRALAEFDIESGDSDGRFEIESDCEAMTDFIYLDGDLYCTVSAHIVGDSVAIKTVFNREEA